MQINITARGIELEDSFKAYVNEKLQKLNHYTDKVKEARVVFSSEKFNQISEITLTGKRLRLASIEKDQDLKTSFDMCAQSAEKQLRKIREKVKDHKIKKFFRGFGRISKKRQDAQLQPTIIKMESFATKPMSPEEAALELEAFKKEFVLFRNAADDNINVLYRRNDGNYGLIEK